MWVRITQLALVAWLSQVAFGHQQPTTLIALDVGSDQVGMNLHVPLSELELAFGPLTADFEPSLRTYLVGHIHPVTAGGAAWSVRVDAIKIASAEQEAIVQLTLVPPAGASLRRFALRYDVILHQVVTHKAIVSIRSDWAGGRVEPTRIGMIAVDTGSGRVKSLEIDLGEGRWGAGFLGMVRLGAEHIREGTDHLLFLLVLLLPATVTGSGGRLFRIVTAFTIGHSLTLLAGALQWLRLPQQPVEVLIAGSILVTAIHAIRPVFPGREEYVAGGFGLVHGLAFAAVLADLQLEAGPMALSVLGFNLGIELMQLLVIACTVPWLILLSRTPAYPWVRNGGAVLAAMAAGGWIVNPVSGQSNGIERLMDRVTEYSPLGIFVLALISTSSYLYSTAWRAEK